VSARGIAYRWFVEYNPMYFASALSVLAGVYLVSHGLPADDFASKLGVTAVTELYELLLIGGAWLLLRAGQRRPAAILGLAALVFILDAAFAGERLFSHARTMSLAPGMRAREALPASLLFALAGPLKLVLLARVFRLRDAGPTLAVAGASVVLAALLPYAIEAAGPADGPRQAAQLFASWLGAPLLGWALTRRAWTPATSDEIRVHRIARCVPFAIAGLFAAHATAWSTLQGLGLSPAHAAPWVLAAALVAAGRLRSPGRAEFAAWAGTALSLGAGLAAPGGTGLWPASGISLLAGAALLALARRNGLRVLLPATVCAFAGLFALGSGAGMPLPRPGPAWALALAAALAGGAFAHRDFRCLLASALAAGATLVAVEPSSRLVPYGAIVAALWLGAWSWTLFPELRRWLPCAAAVGALAVGAGLLWREPALTAPWFGTASVAIAGVGFARRMRPLQVTGLSGAALLAVATRSHYAPDTTLGWGVVLLALGFALLGAGVAFNLRGAPRPS
jgi:hypothetical protein